MHVSETKRKPANSHLPDDIPIVSLQGIYEDKGFPEEDMIGRSDVDAKLKTLASIIKKVSSEVYV